MRAPTRAPSAARASRRGTAPGRTLLPVHPVRVTPGASARVEDLQDGMGARSGNGPNRGGVLVSRIPRGRPSAALVVACLALLIALGGTSFAGVEAAVPNNSVGSSQLKSNAVVAAKIASNAVSGAKIASNAVSGAKIAGNA